VSFVIGYIIYKKKETRITEKEESSLHFDGISERAPIHEIQTPNLSRSEIE